MATDDVMHWSVRVLKHWKRQFREQQSQDLESFWDGRAAAFSQRTSDPAARAYDTALIRCLHRAAHLRPSDTCLDLGCGTGSLALPLARRLTLVTGCDVSGQMLHYLKARAEQQHLDNIIAIHRHWMELVPGRDIGPHDLVIAHRSLGGVACDRQGRQDVVECITRMDRMCRRAAFVIPRSFGVPDDDEFRAQFPEYAQGPAGRSADLATFNLLFAKGLFPRLDYVLLRQVRHFPSIEEEVEAFGRYFGVGLKRRLKRLSHYLTTHATPTADGFTIRMVQRVMVMGWIKAA